MVGNPHRTVTRTAMFPFSVVVNNVARQVVTDNETTTKCKKVRTV